MSTVEQTTILSVWLLLSSLIQCDSLVLHIFNSVSDIRTLVHCRAVSKRFNSLVPETQSLLLKVDRVVSSHSDGDSDWVFLTVLVSIFKSIHHFLSAKSIPTRTRPQIYSAAQYLRGFQRIRELEVELPSGELKLETGTVVKWKAQFGRTLRSCVIIGFPPVDDLPEMEFASAGWLKIRVLWTIRVMIAASARHRLLKDVITEHGEVARLVVRDREGEGSVVMDGHGEGVMELVSESWDWESESEKNRRMTTVPSARMKMWYEQRLQLRNGDLVEGATLVVVSPTTTATESKLGTHFREGGDVDLALRLEDFGDVYNEAVQDLLKGRSCLLEMNSFSF
ncbi:F-box protein [Quillaja saponaria]|uniref:F-box protein n=1 Tax=Quillaja saponaria TaxID=32244 RepID=A0AAD7LWN4_QUISA|nr:F-box protein [Quillaja saponaria]